MAFATGGFGITFREIFKNAIAVDMDAASQLKAALFTNSVTTPNYDTETGYGAGNFPTTPNQVTGTGYTIGGNVITGATLTVATPVATQLNLDATDTPWTTATFSNARGVLVYDDVVSDVGIVAISFGSDFSVTAGTFTIVWNANGIFTLDYA